MPKQIMDYSQTKIYKLCCKNTEITDVYIGHSTNMIKRKCQHKSHCNNPNTKMYNYKVYKFIRDNGGWNNWSMIVIEDYPCENRFQAESRERHWIENLNASLNCVIPTRSYKEYKECHREKYKEIDRKYREKNFEKIKESQKRYHIENKEKIREQRKEYREENSEKIKKHKSEKIQCECGCFITRNHILRHKRSEKHLELISNV